MRMSQRKKGTKIKQRVPRGTEEKGVEREEVEKEKWRVKVEKKTRTKRRKQHKK